MSEDRKDALQFDRAEYAQAPAAATCANCGQGLWQSYFQVGDKAMCERCKSDVELELRQGSGAGRFLRATVYGAGAGAAGAGLWYGVRALTGYEVGLIAILVGLMVGGAVRAGSRARGGWLYQGLAVFLTYTAIVSTYVPFIIQGLKEQFKQQTQVTGAASPVPPAAPVTTPHATPAAASTPEEKPSFGKAVVALLLVAAFVLALAFAAPFLAGFENVIGILIIAFGLWEAWKINKQVPLEISGPFRVGAPPTPAGG